MMPAKKKQPSSLPSTPFQNRSVKTAVPVTLENAHFMFPKFNEKWLIYLDARLDGGGYTENGGDIENIGTDNVPHGYITLPG